jgi:hypothetical protein
MHQVVPLKKREKMIQEPNVHLNYYKAITALVLLRF